MTPNSTPLERVFRRIDFEQLQMPLGFIRLLQAAFCVITLTAFRAWNFYLGINCPDQSSYQYEFGSLDIDELVVHRCNGTETALFEPVFGAGADFVAFLIPLSLFVTVAGLLLYLLCFNHYASDDRLPVLDLIVTVLLTVGWMVGTLSFSMTARAISEATTEANVNKTMEAHGICKGLKKGDDVSKCTWETHAARAPLSVVTLLSL
uniref:MARVEL domain-containing protein n=1 Tax=Globodera pallida TaxID=36090 RepID=A0A183CI97_GLOPA